VAEARLSFRAPARFDDELDLALRIAHLGRSSIGTAVEVLRGDEVLVEGELRHVVLSAQTWKPARMPDWIRTGLEGFS
jgi:acyl-CoA thioester hydrolase